MNNSNSVHETERKIARQQNSQQNTKKSLDAQHAMTAGNVPGITSATIQRTMQDGGRLAPNEIMALQRTVGNRAVLGLLEQARPQGKPTASPAPAIQRMPTVGLEGGTVDERLETQLRQGQNGGSTLSPKVRQKLEPHLGADLANVKVHTDANAVQLNRELGARAFTHKNHIFYGEGQSPTNLKLTAHEAVHTIQQGAVQQNLASPAVQRMGDEVQQVSTTRGETATIQREPWWQRFRRRKQKMTDKDLVNQDKGTGGSLNRVDKVRYNRGIGGSRTKKGFFKPDTMQGMSDRSVASSRLGKWLGLDVVSKEVYAQHGGEKGSVSADVREKMPDMLPLSEKMFDDVAQNQNPDFEDDYTIDEANWQQDDQGVWHTYSGDRNYEHDLHNPVTQKGLSDLQLFDAITGQTDRHGGNIYIDPTGGTVKGIDHDMSFSRGQSQVDFNWSKYHGLPTQVDEKTAKRILKRKAKNLPKVLRSKDGGLTDQEIIDAQARLREVKRYLKQQRKDKKLVKKWGRNTYDKSMNEPNYTDGQKLERSYLKRTKVLRKDAKEIVPVNDMGMEWTSNGLFDEDFELN